MVWKAIEKIDKYEIGDIVPTEIAVVWAKMYKQSPVEEIKEKSEKANKEIVEEVAVEEIVEEPKTFFVKKKKK